MGDHGGDQVVVLLGPQIIRHDEGEPRDRDGGGGENLLGGVEEAGVAEAGPVPAPGLTVLLRRGARAADEAAGVEVGDARHAPQVAPPPGEHGGGRGLPGGCLEQDALEQVVREVGQVAGGRDGGGGGHRTRWQVANCDLLLARVLNPSCRDNPMEDADTDPRVAQFDDDEESVLSKFLN